MWFQQDGARPHFALLARARGRGLVAWLPRSLDLTPMGFFTWGTVKDIQQHLKT
jgi:hypothetical protein